MTPPRPGTPVCWVRRNGRLVCGRVVGPLNHGPRGAFIPVQEFVGGMPAGNRQMVRPSVLRLDK